MTYYIPLYFQFVKGDGALEAGVRLLPLIMFMVVASMINGFLMPRYGLIPVWYIGGSTLALIGTALMCKTFRPLHLRSSNGLAHASRRHRRFKYVQRQNLWLQRSCRSWYGMLHCCRFCYRAVFNPHSRCSQCCGSHDNLLVSAQHAPPNSLREINN
jgi:hypothetical protein